MLLYAASAFSILLSLVSATAWDAPADFHGVGRIHVLHSDDWSTASPADAVGCVSDEGRFTKDDCGIFRVDSAYPYTIMSRTGNCTFQDTSQPTNTDSYYGANDHAWSCTTKGPVDVYDGLYTIVSQDYECLRYHGRTDMVLSVRV
jgi:hypothetical protein